MIIFNQVTLHNKDVIVIKGYYQLQKFPDLDQQSIMLNDFSNQKHTSAEFFI